MALIVALMATLLMLVLGGGVAITSITETSIAANYRDGLQTLYAAEAGVHLAVARLRTIEDWTALTAPRDRPPLVAGPLAALLQSDAVDPRLVVSVSVAADPGGNPDAIVVQSTAGDAGGLRRAVQATVTRLPPDAAGNETLRIVAWR